MNTTAMLLKSQIQYAFLAQQVEFAQSKTLINRDILHSYQPTQSHIEVITGVRRCGKSSLVRQIKGRFYKNAMYLNFEDARIFGFDTSDFSKLDDIIHGQYDAYFFDEIQNVPSWELYIRQLHERNAKVYVTGSNASLLSKELGTRLTGRHVRLELFPFSYTEYLTFTGQEAAPDSLQKYLSAGGFPEYLSDPRIDILQNLLKDIVLRDIAIRYGIRNTQGLMDLTLYLLSNLGKEFSFNRLRKLFSMASTNTVADYMNWLADTYLLYYLPRFSWSAKSRAVLPRKVYAIDNGLAAANTMSFSEDRGRMLENLVLQYLNRRFSQFYYFREEKECDFVVLEQGKCIHAIQVCYEVHADNQHRELAGLEYAMHFFQLSKGIIVTFDQEDHLQIQGKEVLLIPAWKFLGQDLLA
jgi:uncharacterized protein